MELGTILLSVAILGGVGLFFGILIAVANATFSVYEDPRVNDVEEILPGANCGACGYAGCRAFAEGLVEGGEVPATCTVMSEWEREDVAALLGVDAGEAEKRVARLLCAGGTDVTTRKAEYYGIESCAAAVAVTGGGKGCAWGCVGLGDCNVVCDFDAITMNGVGLPVVDPDLCTACGDCVEACPLDLFTIMPVEQRLIVQCRNLLEGEAATDVCAVACNACGRCVVDAPDELIAMKNGLAVVDYEKNELANEDATARCPTGAIVWLEGERQFPAPDLIAVGS